MFIYEGNRIWVEERLRELRVDPAVQAVCDEVGARLDGTDSVLTLCAVDDQLVLRLGPEKTPLRAPEGAALVKQPWTRHPRGTALDRLKNRRLSKSVTRSPEEIEARYASQLAKYEAEWAQYRAQMRMRDARRDGVEGSSISFGRLEMLARSAAVTEEQRAGFRKRADELKRTDAQIEALDNVGYSVNGMFARLDPKGDSTGGQLVFSAVNQSFELSDWTYKLLWPVSSKELELRPWLAAEAALAVQNPLRLRLRSQEACALCGDSPSSSSGPNCLLDALLHWHREHRSEDDLLIDEESAGELLAQGANAIVDSIESGLAWLFDHVGSKVTVERSRQVLRSLESLFCDCLSFDDGLPSRSVAAHLLVEGAFNPSWSPPPPEKPKQGALARLRAKVAAKRGRSKKGKSASKTATKVKKKGKKATTRGKKR